MRTTIYSDNGFAYLARGLQLIQSKGLKRFVIIPILVNLLLFSAAIYWLTVTTQQWTTQLMEWLPGYFQWVEYLIYPLLVIFIIGMFYFLFTSLTNLIAAPFNGLLAEKVEQYESGQRIADDGIAGLIKDIPRTLGREFQKMAYFIPRALGFFLLSLLIPVIGQVIWFVWVCWMMAIQYLDYPFDNHKLPFTRMRFELRAQKGKSLSFGLGITVLTMIPLINLIVMPLAIAAATSLWVDHYRAKALQ
ncbi:sulfate transporter CysZ [Idiomarina sp. OT37-5b]|jgi:CysZ protein|uniref:sulfate transporter CysZ n=1 Tax=Idiomarina sp. OT37-5b TaxID=2100422 RepID=UPI000CFA6157|nr:sulfate transporter CysZ [Idiomarina sp. OT37-5b]AVJ56334.1 sulfate transporter CysZ [Idiomarina sp. OT37-5b]